MKMVGHQTKGQRADSHLLASFAKQFDKSIIVAWLVKNGPPTIAPIKNMVTIAASGVACSTWHACNANQRAAIRQEKCTLSCFVENLKNPLQLLDASIWHDHS